MKKLLAFFFLVLFCLVLGRGWYWATDGFRVSRIQGFDGTIGRERPFSEEAEKALSQRYNYLGRGRQCFAFESEDGKYVIKLPRLDRYRKRILFEACPFGLFKAAIDRRMNSNSERKRKLFESFELSADELREETAIVGMYIAPGSGKQIEIVDRLNRSYQLPLEKTGFILQRKLRLFKDLFHDAISKKDMGEINWILDRLLEVVVRVADKGILSKDGSFLKNFGFDETSCFEIDVGSFYRAQDEKGKKAFVASIHASVETLRVWLLDLDPALLELIDQKLDLIYGMVE